MIDEVGRLLQCAKTTYIIRRGIRRRLGLTEPLRHQPRRGRFADMQQNVEIFRLHVARILRQPRSTSDSGYRSFRLASLGIRT